MPPIWFGFCAVAATSFGGVHDGNWKESEDVFFLSSVEVSWSCFLGLIDSALLGRSFV